MNEAPTKKLPTCCEYHGFGRDGCQQRRLCPAVARKTNDEDLEGFGQAPVDHVLPTMWLPIKARLWLMSVDWFGLVRAAVLIVCLVCIAKALIPPMTALLTGVTTISLP